MVLEMRFETEMGDAELPELLEEFESFAVSNSWEKRLRQVESLANNGTGAGHLLRERLELELAWASLREISVHSGQLLTERLGTSELAFLSFAAMVVNCHHRLTNRGRRRLEGMLRDGMNKRHGLASVAHEMRVACHLMGRGYDVGFHDMETGGGFDFLATKAETSAEVECKYVTCDIGRQIHREPLYRLGDRVAPTMLRYLAGLQTGLLLRLTIPGRMGVDDEQQKELCELLSQAMVSGEVPLENDWGRVRVEEFDVGEMTARWATVGGFEEPRMREALARHFGTVNRNLFVFVNTNPGAIVVVVDSLVKDKVLRAIHDELRRSSRQQLSGSRPAILCCHLADLTEGQLTGLMEKGEHGIGLDYMTLDLLDRRHHVHSVTYTVAGVARWRSFVREGAPIQARVESGRTYTISNPDHEMAGDQRLEVFADG